jgi:hypothetical protein
MLKKITSLVLLAAAWVIFLPSQSAAYNSVKNNNSVNGLSTENLVLQQGRGRGRGNGGIWQGNSRRRNGRWYGYKNYGQYRRTQVGNRRYRMVRQSYWRDGRRSYRWTRIFY